MTDMNIRTQMQNNIYNPNYLEYSKNDAEQAYVRDYKDFDFSRFNEYLNDSEAFDYVKLNVDNLIEYASYKIYETPDYWDLLCMINKREALYSTPVNNDVLNDITDEILSSYFFNPERPYQGPITDDLIKFYREKLFNKLNDKNFENMTYKYLKKTYLSDFLRKFKYNN